MKHFSLQVAAIVAMWVGATIAFGQASSLDDVSFNQKLNNLAAVHDRFRDDTGQSVDLSELAPGKATILMMGYYNCPQLCDLILQNLATSLKGVELVPGKDFDVVALSIDPTETPDTAAKKKQAMVKLYGKPETAGGWHFLTGDAATINHFAASVGFRYASLNKGQQFAHPAGLIVLTPDGHIARYLIGMTFQHRDLQLSLVESSQGKIGSFSDAVLLRCYDYDPTTGRYGFAIQTVLRTCGCLTVLVLVAFMVWAGIRYRQHGSMSAEQGDVL